MPMKYIKVYHDWTEATRMLKDAEKGRLIDAMVRYAKGEGYPDNLSGNEQYVFPMFQMQLDRDGDAYEEISEKRRQAGAKGGKQKLANASKCKQMEANGSKTYHDKDQDHDQDQDQDYLKERFNTHWRTSARARASIAQQVLDEIQAGKLGNAECNNAHWYICNLLAAGVSPEEILHGAEDSRNWTDFCVWISMNGGVPSDDDP